MSHKVEHLWVADYHGGEAAENARLRARCQAALSALRLVSDELDYVLATPLTAGDLARARGVLLAARRAQEHGEVENERHEMADPRREIQMNDFQDTQSFGVRLAQECARADKRYERLGRYTEAQKCAIIADLNLREAAPDLLAALREIADICRGPAATLNELAHAVEQSALGAIARATGGTL